jgi:DNA polymerase-1
MLLIDGDILVYQAISAAEQVVETEPDLFVMFTQLSDAKDNFVSALTSILIRSEQDEFHICLSDRKSNWRKEVYPEYKSNRKKTRLPMGFLEFRKWVEESYPCISKPTLEADDVLGILATKPSNVGKAMIWTIDKDLKTVPGLHLLKEGKTLITRATG